VGVDCGGGGERGLNRGRTISTVDAYSTNLRSSRDMLMISHFFEPLELLITEKNLPEQGGATSINFLFKEMEKDKSLFGRDV
jgi:hypothetical protein